MLSDEQVKIAAAVHNATLDSIVRFGKSRDRWVAATIGLTEAVATAYVGCGVGAGDSDEVDKLDTQALCSELSGELQVFATKWLRERIPSAMQPGSFPSQN